MRDPKRIDRVIEKLRALWHANPDQRLSQLVTNVAAAKTHVELEDYEMYAELDRRNELRSCKAWLTLKRDPTPEELAKWREEWPEAPRSKRLGKNFPAHDVDLTEHLCSDPFHVEDEAFEKRLDKWLDNSLP